jgi:hypothetical protein
VLRRLVTLGVAFGVSVVSFAMPPIAAAATTAPPLPATGYQCVSAGVISGATACQASLAQAEARLPSAKLAVDGTVYGDGSWIVLSPDGLHFDLITIASGVGQFAPAAGPAVAQAYRPVTDVLAGSLVQSSSGHFNTSGYYCGGRYTFWFSATYQTWYLADLQMNTQGYWNFCNSATITSLTPDAWGAGAWTSTSGVIGNGSSQANPWINWYGSNILACCTDSRFERWYVNSTGGWSWQVWT